MLIKFAVLYEYNSWGPKIITTVTSKITKTIIMQMFEIFQKLPV